MNSNIYEIRETNHAEELIQYLTNLVIPKAINRHSLGKLTTPIQDRSDQFIENNFSFDSFDQLTKV